MRLCHDLYFFNKKKVTNCKNLVRFFFHSNCKRKKKIFFLIWFHDLTRVRTVRWATEPTEMCAKATAAAAADTKTWLLHLIIHVRPESTNRPETTSRLTSDVYTEKKLQKQKLNLFSQQIQIKIIFYGLDWKISNKKEKTTNLDQCQHRMPECSLEIIILCSLLELWSTKHTQRTHPYMKRWTIQEMRDKRATTKTTKI